jgi:hypothetical protein
VAKKLAEIRKEIENATVSFYDYLMETEDPLVMKAVYEISKTTKVFIFSGVIRNFFLGAKNNRDIDIILQDEIDLTSFFSNAEIKRNSFGGYKVFYNGTTIDLWYLANTWAFKKTPAQSLDFHLERMVPNTAFFNFSSIVYSLNDKKFYFEDKFVHFLRDKEIDVVFEQNPNYQLCVVNTFYYADKYRLKIKEGLKKFIVKLYRTHDKNYTDVQLKHFGKVIYPNDQIEHRINTIFYPRKGK